LTLDLGLGLVPERPLRAVLPLQSVGRWLSFRSGLHRDWHLHLCGCLRFLSLPSLLSVRSVLRLDRSRDGCLGLLSLLPLFSLGPGLDWSLSGRGLDWRLHLGGRLRLLPLLPLLSLRPGLRLGLGLNLSGNRGGRRLSLCRGFAATSALASSPVSLSLVGSGLRLLGRAVLMLAAAPIVWLRPCCGRARNQKDNSGRNKKRFHWIPQSSSKGVPANRFRACVCLATCTRAGCTKPPVFIAHNARI
jgi:hypothetical protein